MAENSFVINTSINSTKTQSQIASMEKSLVKAAGKAEELKKRMEEVGNSKVMSEDYQAATEELERLHKALGKAVEAKERLDFDGKTDTSAYSKASNDIERYKSEIEELQWRMEKMREAGSAFMSGSETEEYKKFEEELNSLEKEADETAASMQRMKRSFSIGSIASGLSEGASKVSNFFKRIVNGFMNIFRHSNRASQSVGLFHGRLLKMAGAVLVFNQIRKIFSDMVNGMKEGFKGLAQYSKEYNATMSDFKNGLTELKYNMAAAFEPIANAIIPLLSQLVSWLNTAIESLSMFFALISGKGTYTRAKKQTDDYAKSLKGATKAAKGALAAFDDLNVLDKNQGGGGGGSQSASNMFEEAEIEIPEGSLFDKLADSIKEGDYEGVGVAIGEALKNALDNIDWDEIKAKARAIGEKVADFLNGVFRNPELGYSIGLSLAEMLNTGFSFLNSFVHEFDWAALGVFVGSAVNGFFDNIDWPLIYDTFTTGMAGIATAINNFFSTTDWTSVGTGIANAINVLINGAWALVSTLEWSNMGTAIGTMFGSFVTNLDLAKAGETLTNLATGIFDFIKAGIEAVDWEAVGEKVGEFFANIDWQTVLKSAVDALWAGLKAAFKLWKGAFDAAPIETALITGIALLKLGKPANMILTTLSNSIGGSPALESVKSVGSTVGKLFVGAMAVYVAANVGLAIGNAIAGTDYTWGDIGDYLMEGFEGSGFGERLKSWFVLKCEDANGAMKEYWRENNPATYVAAVIADTEMTDFQKKLQIKNMFPALSEEERAGILQMAADAGIWTIDELASALEGESKLTLIPTEENVISGEGGIVDTWENGTEELVTSTNDTVQNVSDTINDGRIKSSADTVTSGISGVFAGAYASIMSETEALVKNVSEKLKEIKMPAAQGIVIGATAVQVKVPKMATGGVTVGSTLANIGEAGREAVLPLENNTGWMDDLAGKLADRMPSGQSGTVVMQIDGQEFARLNMPYMNRETSRVGLNFANA